MILRNLTPKNIQSILKASSERTMIKAETIAPRFLVPWVGTANVYFYPTRSDFVILENDKVYVTADIYNDINFIGFSNGLSLDVMVQTTSFIPFNIRRDFKLARYMKEQNQLHFSFFNLTMFNIFVVININYLSIATEMHERWYKLLFNSTMKKYNKIINNER